jgi:hypothetical protein
MGLQTIIPTVVPGLAETLSPTSKDLFIAGLPGIRSWRNPQSYINGEWVDRLGAGYRDRSWVNRYIGTPTVTAIGSSTWLKFNNVVKLSGLGQLSCQDFNPSLFTIMFSWHPNSTTDNDNIISGPYEAIPSSTAQYLQLDAAVTAGQLYVTLYAVGASYAVIIDASSYPAYTLAANVPHVVTISYSPANGYTMRFDAGAFSRSLASPASNQLITAPQLQTGGLMASSGSSTMLTGGLGDFLIFDTDLTLPINAAALASAEARLVADWPA